MMRILFEPESLRQSQRGSITGVVYIDAGGTLFPGPQWSDFAVVIASWWIDAVATLPRNGPAVPLRFMDGPFSMSATASNGRVVVRGIEHRREDDVRFEVSLELPAFRREVMGYARRVADACALAKITSVDVSELLNRLPN